MANPTELFAAEIGFMKGTEPSACTGAARVDAICDQFEAAWQGGACPSVEQYLVGELAPIQRRQLLVELLHLELFYRQQRGEWVTTAELCARFPNAETELEPLIDELSSARPRRTAMALSTVFDRDVGQRTTHTDAADLDADAHRSRLHTGHVVDQDRDATPSIIPATADRGELPCPAGYVILEQLGRGGMGVVAKARQLAADRLVALKFIRPDGFELLDTTGRRQIIDRFRAEIRAVAQLEHDNIVRVYEVGEVDGMPFFSMQYIAGASLAARIDRQCMPARTVATCLERVARAVHAAHQHGILHRDIKPQNVLLELGTDKPWLLDFGLAKFLGGDCCMTAEGDLMGSPAYASPEQLQSPAHVDQRADVYSLGATLYHALTGRPPFYAHTLPEIVQKVSAEMPVAPRKILPTLDRDLETICLKCLEKDRQRRFATAKEVADELYRYAHGERIGAGHQSWFGQVRRWCARHRFDAALLCAVALLLGALLTLAIVSGVRVRAALRREWLMNRQLEAQRSVALTARMQEHALRLAAEARATRVAREMQLLQDVLRRFVTVADSQRSLPVAASTAVEQDSPVAAIEAVPAMLSPPELLTNRQSVPDAPSGDRTERALLESATVLGDRFSQHLNDRQYRRARRDLDELLQILRSMRRKPDNTPPSALLLLREQPDSNDSSYGTDETCRARVGPVRRPGP